MALPTFTIIDLFYFIMYEDLHEQKFIETTSGGGPNHIWLHTTLEGPWPHYMILEVCWTAFEHFLLGSHGHGSWLVCEVALTSHPCLKRFKNLATTFPINLKPSWYEWAKLGLPTLRSQSTLVVHLPWCHLDAYEYKHPNTWQKEVPLSWNHSKFTCFLFLSHTLNLYLYTFSFPN